MLNDAFLGNNTVIGSSANNKVAFFGATLVSQQTMANFSLPSGGFTTDPVQISINQLAIEAKINEIIQVLRAYGLIQ